MQRIEAQIAVSLAELAENTTGVLDEAKDATIAVLGENQVVAHVFRPPLTKRFWIGWTISMT